MIARPSRDRAEEIWRPIPGHKRWYLCSTLGRIRQLSRIVTCTNGKIIVKRDSILIPKTYGRRYYPCVVLLGNRAGQHKSGTKKQFVHRLVLLTFVGRCPKGKQVLHRDGNKSNNALSNLHYGTAKENGEDKRRHGTSNAGSAHGMSKLSESDVLCIRKQFASRSVSWRELANKYNVCPDSIRLIVQGKTWKHVGGPVTISTYSGKLSPKERQVVIKQAARGVSRTNLATMFSVSVATIANIINHRFSYRGRVQQ